MDKVELYDFESDTKPYKVMTRNEALRYYKTAIYACEGSERERMSNCFFALLDGATKVYNYGDY